jgi:hypothetical protein
MRLRSVFSLAFALLVAIAPAKADDQSEALKQLVNRLMLTTKVIAINDVTDPDKFVPDNDPNTLQIVYIADPNAGKNRVSVDGEVVFFFGDVDVNDQQPYIFKAFTIRAKRQLGIK